MPAHPQGQGRELYSLQAREITLRNHIILAKLSVIPARKRGPDTQLFVKLAFSARIVTEFTKKIPQNHASYTPYVGGIGLSPCEGIPNCRLLPPEHIQYFHSFPSCAAEGIEPW